LTKAEQGKMIYCGGLRSLPFYTILYYTVPHHTSENEGKTMAYVPVEFRLALTYNAWVDAIGQGEIVSRAQMAERMEASYSTANFHLERAVAAGLLNKQWGYIGKQSGWVYGSPETLPRLEGY